MRKGKERGDERREKEEELQEKGNKENKTWMKTRQVEVGRRDRQVLTICGEADIPYPVCMPVQHGCHYLTALVRQSKVIPTQHQHVNLHTSNNI